MSEISVILIALQICTSWAFRDLSDIRYKFTPCGASGTEGPTFSQCIGWYTSNNSSLINGNKLFEFNGNQVFSGSQGFRVPTSGIYNITVAGASGGRGLCSFQHGRGLLWEGTVHLQNTQNLLVLVGQKGLGPCDISDLPQCNEPPEDFKDAGKCFLSWHTWLISQPDLSETDKVGIFNFAGGGGGGGASMIRVQERKTGLLQTWPLVVAGGGGGTSSNMSFTFLDALNIAIPPGADDNTSLQERFTMFIDAKSTDRDYSISDEHNFTATRGYVAFLADIYRNRPGAGGGYLPATSLYQDGSALNQSEGFARGGYDCLLYSADLNRHTLIESAHGGFGGGGGQCQSGGSGGGFSGGSIFSGAFGIAGNGGFSTNISSGLNLVQQTKIGLNDDLDGYIEIIHANCECSYKCDLMYDVQKFRCICPDDFILAPNEFDCFQEIEYNASNLNYIRKDQYIFQAIDLEMNTGIFSVYAEIEPSASTNGVPFSTFGYEEDGNKYFCLLAFLDSNGHIVLTSNIARTTQGLLNELVERSNSNSFLQTASEVSSAVLVSNFYCKLKDNLQLNISYMGNDDQGTISGSWQLNITEVVALAKVIDSVNFLAEDTSLILASEETHDNGSKTIITLAVIPSSAVIGVTLVIAFLIMIIICFYCNNKRKKLRRTLSWSRRHNEYTTMDIEGSLISNHLYIKHSLQKSDDDRSTSYCFVDSEDLTNWNSCIGASVWEYSRKDLVYMKELGEGNFGKVLLMKAIGISHISRDVLVAVKTLSSTDPTVVKKFTNEANLMKKLSHPNIVSILAVIFDDVDEDNAPLMVLEYMPYGDLQSFLRKYRPGILFDKEEIHYHHFINFARDISHAIKFLSEKEYIHRDIACRNCLVDSSLNIKLSDFGLTVKSTENGIFKGENNAVLPIKWLSPESLLFGIFSTSSDIWSFGVLLWEMATYGELPLPNVSNKDLHIMAENRTLHHSRPPNCPDYYYDLITRCHQYNQQDRITIDELFLQLTEKLGQNTETGNCFVIINH